MAAKAKKKYKKLLPLLGVVIAAEIVLILVLLVRGKNVSILNPAGTIAEQQKNLIVFAAGLSLFVIIPVFLLLGFILWRYRDGNEKSKYRPNWDGNAKLETIWWGIPMLIILLLAVVTWKTSHSLDPYKSISNNKEPMTIQVVALQWKWLFIYPGDHFATVNYLEIPEDTPINFRITSDAPMNSFWIPRLGGQVYAMTGMSTQLHLMADNPGVYEGMSANISGEGFSGMKFKVVSSTKEDFEKFHQKAHTALNVLNKTAYDELAKPTKNEPVILYKSVDSDLYDTIIGKYMHSHGSMNHTNSGADESNEYLKTNTDHGGNH